MSHGTAVVMNGMDKILFHILTVGLYDLLWIINQPNQLNIVFLG